MYLFLVQCSDGYLQMYLFLVQCSDGSLQMYLFLVQCSDGSCLFVFSGQNYFPGIKVVQREHLFGTFFVKHPYSTRVWSIAYSCIIS